METLPGFPQRAPNPEQIERTAVLVPQHFQHRYAGLHTGHAEVDGQGLDILVPDGN